VDVAGANAAEGLTIAEASLPKAKYEAENGLIISQSIEFSNFHQGLIIFFPFPFSDSADQFTSPFPSI
jgi:hypothetical protein